jgi:hypothetical protein
MWDAFIDVWAILAGALKAPSRVVEDLRRAASVLLYGICVGDIVGNGYRSTESLRRDLLSLGGSVREGEQVVQEHGGLEALRSQIFGARKRVVESAGIPPYVLPKPPFLPASMDVAESTVVQLVRWAEGRKATIEVLEGPHVGEELTDWPLAELRMADQEFAESLDTRLRLVFRNGHRMNVAVAPGYNAPQDGGIQCLSDQPGCEQYCPMFGAQICEKYQIGIGHPWRDADTQFDRRTFREQPRWKQDLQRGRAIDTGRLRPAVTA